jgi:hypothetical protein
MTAALLFLCLAAGDAPPDPPATTEWHREPVLEKTAGRNIVLYNHADASLESATIVSLLQTQYDFLKEFAGFAPPWILVHVGNNYRLGFMIRNGPQPEMFLQASSIFDTQVNYAHEMMHCFLSELGELPHWFNESMSDVAWADSEIDLWKRRRAGPFLQGLSRIDYRSYEIIELRIAHGPKYFRQVCAVLARRREECRRILKASEKLETRNLFLLSALSEAAGVDLTPRFKEWGFNPRTREKQRGY